MRVAIIGLGEAGAIYATALHAAGDDIRGCDPSAAPTQPGVTRRDTVAETVADAQAVIVLTNAAAAEPVARDPAAHVQPGSLYADFTSSGPASMAALADKIQAAGGVFADVAILGPIPLHGAQTPLMTSGSGASALAALMSPIGARVTVLDQQPAGAAMAHKLLRSVFMKGLASVVCEAVAAGEAAGTATGHATRSPPSSPATVTKSSTASYAAPDCTPAAAHKRCETPAITSMLSESTTR
jgi:3-hydroxyisobutyrate dehydrogenase-like beta-hydroxyacid dehydrogenase